MRVLITGGTGFVGNNLARALLSKGYGVGLICRKESKNWRIQDLYDKVKRLETDLSDKKSLKKVVGKYQPDIIYHLATYGAYPGKQKDLEMMIKTNIIGTSNLIEAAKDIPIINAGTNSEYGIKNAPMKETDICMPHDDYGKTKLSQTLYCQKEEIPTLRLISVYGAWEDPNRLIPTLIKAKIKELPLNLINSVRDYTYIEDVVNAFIKAGEKYDEIKGEIINISAGEQINMKNILSVIDNINPKKLKINWNFKPIQKEPFILKMDINKAKKLLNWKPHYTLEQGLRETYNWWGQNQKFF